ncbi:MAG: hypothetical protein Ct9H300mP25_12380 [Acidobacteriota bacterium]|mgnify:FL=1|jgi:uncharacterized membrane protein YozB (DUF420 family)|nr:MAG: hypothetical protein Ct9H300mP25_12380 [Acidobacteriota bacterium]
MLEVTDLPEVNATLNAISTLLLATGYIFIRRGQTQEHRLCMLAAFATSALFLASYLIYHFNVGSVAFTGQGTIRTVYFTILISHIILAIAILPMAIVTLLRALRGQLESHRRIARWTLPLWLYVSVTGVVVYWMLYQM